MTLNEQWRDIPGYEGLYQVSNFGRIWSNERVVTVDYSNNYRTVVDEFKYTQPGKIMKLRQNKGGYVVVSLTKNKIQKKYMVHRLVAQAFIPNPNNLPFINHKDENKQNNHTNNLEWCDAKYNTNYGTCIERRSYKQRYTNSRRRPVVSIDESGNEKYYLSAWDASRQLGAYQSNIWKAIHSGKKCSGYYWKYKEGGNYVA